MQRAVFMVPVTGLEPVRHRWRRILSPLRLPFHHTGILPVYYSTSHVKYQVLFLKHAYRLNAAMYQICHCEAVGRGNLQHRSVMTDVPINIEHVGFTMLIGWMPGGTALLEIPTGFRPRNDRFGSLYVLPDY